MSRIRLRIIAWIVAFCITVIILRHVSPILVHGNQAFAVIFYPSIVSEKYKSDDVVNLGFSLFEFEQAKLREIQLKHEYELTAILLHWKRLQGVRKTVQYVLQTHLFKEIIVWNNNPDMNLTVHQLLTNQSANMNIRIINSNENLKDEAKYRACAEATTRACFYVDDDWDTSYYLNSLIASFRTDPYLLHSVTDPYTFYTNLIWSYFDAAIDLHTGFSWIGCGSVFLREHAQRHLQLLHKFLSNDSSMKSMHAKDHIQFLFLGLIQLSDVFFSIWLNDIPSQMDTNIRPQHSASIGGALPFSSTPHFLSLQYRSSVAAIRILEHSLRFDRSNTTDLIFLRQQNRRFPCYIKSPSLTDDFIFYSNVLPFDMQNVTFNISRDFERATRQRLPGGPHVEYIVSHSTWKAVDGNLTTCWHSTRSTRSDDFYAIDFLHAQTNLTFVLSIAHSSKLQTSLEVDISFDGLWWISYRSQKGIYPKITANTQRQPFYTILFRSDRFTRGFQSFRYIRFKAINSSDDRFQVCELSIIAKTNITNT